MALLEWRDDFRTGIDGVDHEHQALIEQINAVYALIGNPANREQVIDGLGEIYGSISAHFALEEQMMKRNAYAEYHEHQNDHERLLDEIREISDEFEATAQLDDARLKRKLADWFQLHFKTFDSRLHRMAEMREHETVGPITLKSLIQNAKNRLIRRPRG
jgi:hemerythrin